MQSNGIIPMLPSSGNLHTLFAKQLDDPDGAIGRLDGHIVHADCPVDE